MAARIISELRYTRQTKSPVLARARALAVEIEELLGAFAAEEVDRGGGGATGRAGGPSAYQLRLANGLTQSLIDQLEELEGAPSSGPARARSSGTDVD